MKLILITALLLSSCNLIGPISLNPDGCFWTDYKDKNGNPISVAACLDKTVKTRWLQPDGTTLLAVKKPKQDIQLFIVNKDGTLTPFETNEPPQVPVPATPVASK